MGQIADALSQALPLSLETRQLEDPAARARYGASLEVLADSAASLERHGRSREASFAYLSRSLADDAQIARRRLEDGLDAESQFVVRQLVQDCVACHSRLPDLDDSALGARLLTQLDPGELPLHERVRLQAATRQFDAALDGYEELFRDPEVSPAQLDLEGRLLEYLTISIRVKQDLRRPRWSLERMAQRPDVPDYLSEDLAIWYTTLDDLAERPRIGDDGASARALVQDSHLEDTPAYDRRGYIHALVASSLLHQHLNAATLSSDELAEAYYLLGLTETRASRSLWLSEADVYLETSIRSSPGSPHAARAYELLEHETLAGYTGSAGLQLPEDVEGRLAELRALIDAASVTPPASDRP
jgi:plasmid stabilization system protein ParE